MTEKIFENMFKNSNAKIRTYLIGQVKNLKLKKKNKDGVILIKNYLKLI